MASTLFKAGIFVDDETQARESGNLAIDGEQIVFRNDTRLVRFPVSCLEIELGGTANRIAYMRHMTQPKITLHTDDFSFFKDPVFENCEGARQFKIKKQKHHSVFFTILAALLFLFVGSFYLAFIEKDFLVGLVVDRIPPEMEIALGDKVFDLQYKISDVIITDTALNASLNKLAKPLLDVTRGEGFEFKLHIAKNDMVNAFALPGGHIVVHSALIEKSETAAELLGVLAHEIAHVNLRHSLKQLVHEIGAWFLISAITSGVDQLVPALDRGTRFFLSQSFSRTQESEADEVGASYLQEAGISPEGLISFFEHLQEEEKGFLSAGALSFLATHPATEQRIRSMKELLAGNKQTFNDLELEYNTVKDQLRRVQNETSD